MKRTIPQEVNLENWNKNYHLNVIGNNTWFKQAIENDYGGKEIGFFGIFRRTTGMLNDPLNLLEFKVIIISVVETGESWATEIIKINFTGINSTNFNC